MKNLKFYIVVIPILLIMTLTFFELICRYFKFHGDTFPVYLTEDEKLPYRMKANTKSKTVNGHLIEINKYGFRDKNYSLEKGYNVNRYIFLGDSTTFGYGLSIDEVFTERLELKLNKLNNNKLYEVLNMGHSGFNLIDYLIYFEDVGINFSPDILFVGIMGNDFTINSLSSKIINGILISEDSIWNKYNVPTSILKILRNSSLYLTLGKAYKNLNNSQNELYFNRVEINKIKDVRIKINEVVNNFVKISNKNSIQIYFLYFPTFAELKLNRYISNDLIDILQQYTERYENIKFLNLFSNLKPKKNLIFDKQDLVHPNSKGHELISNIIFKELKKNRFKLK